MLASSVVDRGFEPRSGQTKDYKIGICCFSAKHAALIKEKEQTLVGSESLSKNKKSNSACLSSTK
jgi:hypothetical protein